jgi:molybdopterin synthase catalytic subunit
MKAGTEAPATVRAGEESMTVRVRLFAVLRESAGREAIDLRLPAGATAADAFEELTRRPDFGELLQRLPVRLAVNREIVTPQALLHESDELALIPPVSGGARLHARVTERPLSPEAISRIVGDPRAGAIVVFQGVTREVERLEYEAYAEMAEDVMAKLAADLQARHDLCAVAIHHRVGRLEIGEASVVIAVSAPHRQAALAACKEAIDTLKETVPLWKKEVYEGGEEWIGRGS